MTILLPLFLAFSALPAAADSKATDTVKSAKISKAQRRKQSKAESRDMEMLQRSATLYWEGVRWNDTEKASNFIENPGARLEFQAWLDEQNADHKILDVKIIGVDVQNVTDKESPISRTAVIKVASEGYKMPDQVLKKTVEAQQWYRTASGWWVQWAPPTTPTKSTTP
jgi:hypothetical protein